MTVFDTPDATFINDSVIKRLSLIIVPVKVLTFVYKYVYIPGTKFINDRASKSLSLIIIPVKVLLNDCV